MNRLTERGRVHAELLVDQTDPALADIVTAVTKEIDFCIVEKRERDPWGYAAYHCTTASNLYSGVHWALIRPGRGIPVDPA